MSSFSKKRKSKKGKPVLERKIFVTSLRLTVPQGAVILPSEILSGQDTTPPPSSTESLLKSHTGFRLHPTGVSHRFSSGLSSVTKYVDAETQVSRDQKSYGTKSKRAFILFF